MLPRDRFEPRNCAPGPTKCVVEGHSDGGVVFQGRQLAGNVLTYIGEEEVELETGNITAIEIIFNQRSVDPISDSLGTPARLLLQPKA